MKTTIVTLSLLMTTIAFAAPAAAECAGVAETGTFACANVHDANNYGIGAWQDGAGGAQIDAYEFSFWGQTMRGKNVFVYTEPVGPIGGSMVMASEFCFVAPDGTCAGQDHSVAAYNEATGYSSAYLYQSSDYRVLCYSVGDEFGCEEF